MGAQLTVLQSFPAPRPPSVNPYTALLGESLRKVPGVTVLNFTWKTALRSRYDVFHAHWPEILVSGHSPLKKLVRQALTVLLMARLRIKRIPVVRTVHNIGLPSGITRREVFLLRMIDRQTTLRIRLNTETPVEEGKPFATIPHGHFRDWFAGYERNLPVPGRFGYVGRVRRYKGVEAFVEAFRQTRSLADGLSAQVGGYPSTPELAETILRIADGDDRIAFDFTFISDELLVDIVTSAELMVFPYREMHNSSAAITALSLDRPVLMPANPVNRMLGEEVGNDWVYGFEGELTAKLLLDTLDRVRRTADRTGPNLDLRGWDRSALAHVAAYREAIDRLRPGRR